MGFQHKLTCSFHFIVFFPNWKQTLRVFIELGQLGLTQGRTATFHSVLNLPLMLRGKQHAWAVLTELFILPVPGLQTRLGDTKDTWHLMTTLDWLLFLLKWLGQERPEVPEKEETEMQTELNNEVMSLWTNWNSCCHVPGSHFKCPQNKGNGLSLVPPLTLPLPLSLNSPGDQMQNAEQPL